MDSVVFPAGTGSAGHWEVNLSPGMELLGTIEDDGVSFTVTPKADTKLAGIPEGPYVSKQSAMKAISMYLEGTCKMFGG